MSTASRPLPFAPHTPSRFVRVFGAIARACAGGVQALLHRRDVKLMLQLDDRMLKDIGLVRNDILGALAERIDRDPSVILRLRAVERRALRRVDGAPVHPASRPTCDA